MNISLEIQTKTWVLHRIATSLWTLKSTWAELSWEASLLCSKQGWRKKDKKHKKDKKKKREVGDEDDTNLANLEEDEINAQIAKL